MARLKMHDAMREKMIVEVECHGKQDHEYYYAHDKL